MNVNRFLILALIIPLFCFSQNKKEDVYFIVNKKHEKYILPKHIIKSNVFSFGQNSSFTLYNRVEYNIRQEEIQKKKREGTYISPWLGETKIPKTLSFNVKSNKKEIITHCDIHEKDLNIVDYKWLIYYSWKENNPNILFKNLYFLFKLDKNKYVKYKVERTIIAH